MILLDLVYSALLVCWPGLVADAALEGEVIRVVHVLIAGLLTMELLRASFTFKARRMLLGLVGGTLLVCRPSLIAEVVFEREMVGVIHVLLAGLLAVELSRAGFAFEVRRLMAS